MKVLLVHNRYREAGGEDTAVASERALLRRYGHSTVVYERDNAAIDESGPLSRLSLATRTVWAHDTYRELRRLLAAERPDVAHFHNYLPQVSPSGYYACRTEGVPVVQTLHNFRLICPGSRLSRGGEVCELCVGRRFAWPGVRYRCYRGNTGASAAVATMSAFHGLIGTWRRAVDSFIALNEFNRAKFVEGGLPANRIAVLPNFLFPDPGPGRGAGGFVLYVGRLAREKGLAVLVRAWERLNGTIPLKIVGEGAMAPRVREAAERHDSVEWLGFRPHDEVLALLDRAEALVVPSIDYENFPITLIEAFAKGVPVLVSDHGSLAEIVEEGRTGLRFAPGDPEHLAERVAWLWGHGDERRALGRRARAEFERRYTGRHHHDRLLEIFRSVIADREPHQPVTEGHR